MYTIIEADEGKRFSTLNFDTVEEAQAERDRLALKFGKEFCLRVAAVYQVTYYDDAIPGHATPENLGTFRSERDARRAARERLGCTRLVDLGDGKYVAPGSDEFSAYVEIYS